MNQNRPASTPLRIALIGYGKMGHVVENLALQHGHKVVARIDQDTRLADYLTQHPHLADVAIEFTTPAAAPDNLAACIEACLPVVCGTTGWYDHLPRLTQLLQQHPSAALFYAPNFSIGVNIALRAAALLAKFRSRFPQYAVAIDETHHTAKLDAPSGTAIAFAQPFLKGENAYTGWELTGEGTSSTTPTLSITAHRVGSVPGVHTVCLDSPQDTITLTHEAKNREGFALGALAAAEFLIGRAGLFSINDLLHE